MTPASPIRLLYLSYDGMLEPLGRSQVLAYLKELATRCEEVNLVSFEKPEDLDDQERMRRAAEELRAAGIRWRPLRYHKIPSALATAYDIAAGIATGFALIRKRRVNLVHARSYVAALQALWLKKLTGTPWIFDMRGFWPDERVDGGIWRADGAIYGVVKRLERRFLADADEIVTLTERSAATIRSWTGRGRDQVTVIPTCVDLDRFTGGGDAPPPDGAPRFVYSGSVGTWYCLEAMIEFFLRARRRFPGAALTILTRNVEEATRALGRYDVPAGTVDVQSVSPDGVPLRLAGAYTGLAFYKPGFSRQATCPTKIGEYLALGVPVVSNDAVGDVVSVVEGNGVGAVLTSFEDSQYDAALDALACLWRETALRARCRQVAESVFSLQLGVRRYWAIYQRLASRGAALA